MERVTYILGAGFSAPLGLPVMSNFLFKSRDMYFSDKEKYKYFSNVFESISKLSVIKNYYNADLFNIEEILSITEMMSFLDGKKLKAEFSKYISEVIEYYTPTVTSYSNSPQGLPSNWEDFVFGRGGEYTELCYLIGHLLRVKFEQTTEDSGGGRVFHANRDDLINTRYSVLSLNYDRVLENIENHLATQYVKDDSLSFNKDSYDPNWDKVHLMKLHGCVENGEIVPPTWAKGTHPSIVPIWKNAFHILKESNHIRFIGYSLPTADSYLKYLLKSAIVDSKHLKSIDVICLDQSGDVKERFNNFFEFNYYRFKNSNVLSYASGLKQEVKKNLKRYGQEVQMSLNKLETYHEMFMRQ
ncbi:MAG: SIR2 family protein [Kangiellaceae bacterium]|nr:SIR2 family protein [Kangiellaceae bacterium]